MRTRRTDVLVIGLGPAGACAARTAVEAGLQVTAIDRRVELGEPVQCAEFIPNPVAGYARQQGLRVQRIESMQTELPSNTRIGSKLPGLMIERGAFDRALAGQAADSGADLLLGCRLFGLDPEHRQAQFRDADYEEHTLEYKVLIAADGPSSAVGRLLGLQPLRVVHTRQYTVPLMRPKYETEVFLSDDYPGGYAWVFPKGELANIGLGADRQYTVDLKGPLDALHRRLVSEGQVGARIIYRTGGAIPVGGIRTPLVQNRVLFAGDAAGLTHPITGAGIHAAIVSGEAAGQAAAGFVAGDAGSLQEFQEDVCDLFQTSLDRAVRRRQELSKTWRTPRAGDDQIMRRGWIAFDEYFAA